MTTIARAYNELQAELDTFRRAVEQRDRVIADAVRVASRLRKDLEMYRRHIEELTLHRDACQCAELEEEVKRLRCRLEELGEEA